MKQTSEEANYSAQNEEYSDDLLLKALDDAINIMVQENDFLRQDEFAKAVDLLPKKTELIERLNALITASRDKKEMSAEMTDAIKSMQDKFNQVSEENMHLLKGALQTQATVMKILVESATQDSQQGYNRSGSMVADSSRAFLSLNNQI
ncbi:hypothetical protein GT348_08995 (plasmid) [Aristophania vespae]|uniref:Flagellar protein FlgN n=1 Tax=Aristophania vespae TaxID=2697033 RepID=A0A6P1NIW6_9PROT|nr:hypothetical protein [Aristophania vespae]QHI96484.1 hypothetical protein GT348_08995 [Aristophania vespae]